VYRLPSGGSGDECASLGSSGSGASWGGQVQEADALIGDLVGGAPLLPDALWFGSCSDAPSRRAASWPPLAGWLAPASGSSGASPTAGGTGGRAGPSFKR
jgi:hypothetical protein